MNGEPLDWWLDRINLLIDMMGDVDLGGAIDLDYSAASLTALEAAARDRLADPAEALYDDQQSFTASVVAYLGEALMRVGGGRWDWAAEAPADVRVSDPLVRQRLAEHRWRIDSAGEPDAGGFPIIRPDPASGLAALSPTHLLLEALASDGGAVWVTTYEHWKQVVQDTRLRIPAGCPSRSTPSPTAFSPLRRPRRCSMTGWLGWNGDPITANFKIQLNDDEGYTGPFNLLSFMITEGEPGDTRAYYDQWVG